MVPEEIKSMTVCPLCASQATERLRSYQVESICKDWEKSFQMDVRGEFHGLKEFESKKCMVCKFEFYIPEGIAGSAQLYEKLEQFDWYYLPRKWEHDVALDDLNGCKNGIEIGAGRGDFVARVRKEKSISFEGCELNPKAIEAARLNGVNLALETVEDLARTRIGNYDAVCSFQVLEHLTEPASFLNATATLLRPGGKLLLGLPNRNSFLGHQYNLLDLPPHHVSKWSHESLERIPVVFPFTLKRIAHEPLADYHVEGFVEAYAGLLARRGLPVVAHPAVQSRIARIIRETGVRRALRGQSIYACYIRV